MHFYEVGFLAHGETVPKTTILTSQSAHDALAQFKYRYPQLSATYAVLIPQDLDFYPDRVSVEDDSNGTR